MTDTIFDLINMDTKTSLRELSWQVKKRAAKLNHKYKVGKEESENLIRNYLSDCLGGYEGTLEDYLCLENTVVKANE